MQLGDRVRVTATGQTGTIEDIRETGRHPRYYVLFDAAGAALRRAGQPLDPDQPSQPGVGAFYSADELAPSE